MKGWPLFVPPDWILDDCRPRNPGRIRFRDYWGSILVGFLGFLGWRRGVVAAADAGDDFAHEFFEAAFAGFVIGLGALEGLFPSGGEARGLFAHDADGVLGDLELAGFGAAWFVLEGGDVDAEVLVLFAQILEVRLEALGAGGVDPELGIEVTLKFAAFVLEAFELTLLGFSGSEAGFPDEGGEEKAKAEAPNEGFGEEAPEGVHSGRIRSVRRLPMGKNGKLKLRGKECSMSKEEERDWRN